MSTNETKRQSDLRAAEPHYSYREVAAALHCPDPAVIEPPDPISSDLADAAVRQCQKRSRGTSS